MDFEVPKSAGTFPWLYIVGLWEKGQSCCDENKDQKKAQRKKE